MGLSDGEEENTLDESADLIYYGYRDAGDGRASSDKLVKSDEEMKGIPLIIFSSLINSENADQRETAWRR